MSYISVKSCQEADVTLNWGVWGEFSGQGVGMPIRGVPHPRASSGEQVPPWGQTTAKREAWEMERIALQVLHTHVPPSPPNPQPPVPQAGAGWPPPSQHLAVPLTPTPNPPILLPLAKFSWKGGARTKATTQHVKSMAGEPVCPASTVSAHTRRGTTFAAREGAALDP